ncbi:GBS Bsp-like repeat-containing protein [Streptococcus loxodontisalivarius]|uniref:N-acetylmuramoyl-L-alanine amidase n=1 Tax=Streptococcus loxodontisalivarius TaxID=1349415 RepID=A0ABS2PSY8_9STRE|nr:GBS Bsp-like repeat-containing protein [Streptococcus loxodontisalivarius]MBM7643154.1 N-acetylmuramoyl-L-alanine amidase [Streptococcus loxodontisalivarius]
MFAVWGDPNDQNDLIWYTASAAGAAYVDLSKHKEYGKYNIHTYANRNGQMVGLDVTSITIVTDVKVAVTSKSTDAFTITVSNVPDSISSVTIPVWTDKNNQDDIKWYTAQKTASKTYTVTVATKDHNSEFGHYNIHVYGQSTITGGLIGLSATDGYNNVDNRKTATVSLVNYAENKTSFDVAVVGSSATKTLTGVRIAAWSEDKGQDDLKWYAPAISNNQAKQTISIADLSNTSGNYTVHVYTDYTDGTTTGTNLGTFKITKPASKTEVTSNLTNQGIALHVTSTEVRDYKKVKFAVWSQEKDQDDIKWYDADASGNALALYTDHSGYDTYNIHTYSFENGRAVGLAVSTIELPKPSAKVAVEKTDDTHYKITVTETPQYITSVTIPVWSNKNDQDDIKWTSASKNADGSYTAIVSLSDHKLDTGQYQAHVYANSLIGNNSLVGLGVTSFTVELPKNLTTPSILVTEYDKDKGIVDILVDGSAINRSIKSISVAAWSEEGQSNIHWYTVTPTNNQATIQVNQLKHRGVEGTYTIHAYVDYQDGERSGYVVGDYLLASKNLGTASQGNYSVVTKTIYLDAGHGGYDSGAYYYNTAEKTVNLAVESLVKSKLEQLGYSVVTTRDSDVAVGLLDRSSKANASDSDLFISIHFNASTSASAQGIETYYYQYAADYPSRINKTYHNDTKRLELSAILANDIQSAVISGTGAVNNGVRRETFAVLRETTAPAVLLELGYLSNASENQKIRSTVYQEKLATAIVSGIEKYYQTITL